MENSPANLLDILNKHKKEEKQRKTEMTKNNILNMLKQKFLCGIDKAEPGPNEDNDDNLVQMFFPPKNEGKQKTKTTYRSLIWTDSIANISVKQILTENQNFDMEMYLNCAKLIYLTYSGKLQQNYAIYEAFTYVLTHARVFGEPVKNVFDLESDGSFEIKFKDISNPLSDSIYMRKITAFINELRIAYSMTSYIILNVNVTYLTLLILRRFVRNDTQFMEAFQNASTHDNYVKLCPDPLSSKLPKISEVFNKNINGRLLKPAVILAIHAFLTVNDEKTKQILQATCIQYIEWTGLQMPCLFFKVARFYEISEAKLWDGLSSVERTHKSLIKLAKDYYAKYEKSKAVPETVSWFPYCRALDGDYHRNLSAAENKETCMLMAYLVDFKIGMNKSFVRNSHWAKTIAENELANIFQEAKSLSQKHPFA